MRELETLEPVAYVRHEIHHDPEPVMGSFIAFVYDIPYLGACGVFPPLHVANAMFESGGGDGGMSPGASWQPFRLAPQAYDELTREVRATDPQTLAGQTRYYHIQFTFDESFDSIHDRFAWGRAVCGKHRAEFRRKNDELARQLGGD